jgi:hypothetical protein
MVPPLRPVDDHHLQDIPAEEAVAASVRRQAHLTHMDHLHPAEKEDPTAVLHLRHLVVISVRPRARVAFPNGEQPN